MTPTQDTPRTAYLRHRPFLIVEEYIVPAQQKGPKQTHTERKGWMAIKENISTDARPEMVDRVTDQHMVRASVIIDILRDTVVKNRLGEPDADVLAVYKMQYADIIERGKNRWFSRSIQHQSREAHRPPRHSAGPKMTATHAPDAFLPVSRKV